jgi:hypothetical protein
MAKAPGAGQVPLAGQRAGTREITENQLRMLLAGIDFWNTHQQLSYHSVV